jgi:hypothetical protein
MEASSCRSEASSIEAFGIQHGGVEYIKPAPSVQQYLCQLYRPNNETNDKQVSPRSGDVLWMVRAIVSNGVVRPIKEGWARLPSLEYLMSL